MFTFDNAIHISTLLVIAKMAYHVIKASNRIEDILKDFPPHRHVNGKIIFAKGFEPAKSETLSEQHS